MQLTIHATRPTPHSASRLVQEMSAWSVKTRRAPSRPCRDARVDGHTTTAVHEIEYISSIEYTPPLPRSGPACVRRQAQRYTRCQSDNWVYNTEPRPFAPRSLSLARFIHVSVYPTGRDDASPYEQTVAANSAITAVKPSGAPAKPSATPSYACVAVICRHPLEGLSQHLLWRPPTNRYTWC